MSATENVIFSLKNEYQKRLRISTCSVSHLKIQSKIQNCKIININISYGIDMSIKKQVANSRARDLRS